MTPSIECEASPRNDGASTVTRWPRLLSRFTVSRSHGTA
jgi:hypothetical protein